MCVLEPKTKRTIYIDINKSPCTKLCLNFGLETVSFFYHVSFFTMCTFGLRTFCLFSPSFFYKAVLVYTFPDRMPRKHLKRLFACVHCVHVCMYEKLGKLALTLSRHPEGEENYGAFRPVLQELKKHSKGSNDTKHRPYKITQPTPLESHADKKKKKTPAREAHFIFLH